ncbi:hypothetical protein BCR41DRAFT_357451 [Lobosporangium transversale]|uniref:Uncharacterized protein n=1 Tax=Lobosporangium transversale TaxID=64571 RepID=A0A1Y2GGU8_9FUNG|nr:hypothetical protein BCR41DRAFT_357451 [Lobosporangium transversale]ORZ10594.1 hypothetical protein BCR41DRAFT_357451 [Lobosporangium transversale]|eukprot:XP_021879315.1 hypothetical protein BCR41DRAFT_357451 [Lobosporangium transversale]
MYSLSLWYVYLFFLRSIDFTLCILFMMNLAFGCMCFLHTDEKNLATFNNFF